MPFCLGIGGHTGGSRQGTPTVHQCPHSREAVGGPINSISTGYSADLRQTCFLVFFFSSFLVFCFSSLFFFFSSLFVFIEHFSVLLFLSYIFLLSSFLFFFSSFLLFFSLLHMFFFFFAFVFFFYFPSFVVLFFLLLTMWHTMRQSRTPPACTLIQCCFCSVLLEPSARDTTLIYALAFAQVVAEKSAPL